MKLSEIFVAFHWKVTRHEVRLNAALQTAWCKGIFSVRECLLASVLLLLFSYTMQYSGNAMQCCKLGFWLRNKAFKY